jgi:uncharacterized protein DUF4128
MPLKAVADLFEQRLIANWTACPVIPYDTIAEPPADVPAFLVQQYPVVQGSRSVLQRHFVEDGIYRLVLNVRRGIGLAQGLTWTDELHLLFNSIRFVENAQLETFVPDGPIVDDNSEEGDWIVYSLLIPYRYQYESGEPVTVEAAGAAGGMAGAGT